MEIESAWPAHPDYRIDVLPVNDTVRVWCRDLLLAESKGCVRVCETDHVDRVYVPEADVRWHLFQAAEGMHSVCPFKGRADYWNLTAVDPAEDGIIWSYPEPFEEVGGIMGFVGLYHERLRVEIEEGWAGDRGDRPQRVFRFPEWGDAADLLQLIDVEPTAPGRFTGPPYRTIRNVVEGGQLLSQAIVAASKSVPGQRATSAYMVFPKPASFDAPLDVDAEVVRSGRTFSTVEVRISQESRLRSAGIVLLDAGATELIRGSIPMPDVVGPEEAADLDMGVTGRDLRIVDAAYDPDPDRVGPPEINAWCRFREAPTEPYLHAALLAQSTTHWTIAAAMRPHAGVGEALAHETISTGIMSVAIAFHEDFDVSEWLLYANPAIYAGRGLAQGEGHVFTRDGRLVATYTVQASIRPFATMPQKMGLDASNAM